MKNILLFKEHSMLLFWSFVFLFATNIHGSWGQTTIAADQFESVASSPNIGFTFSGGAYQTGNTTTTNAAPLNSPKFSQGTRGYGINNGTAILTSGDVNTAAYSSVAFSMKLASFSTTSTGNGADAADFVKVEVSPDGGLNYYLILWQAGNGNLTWAFTQGSTYSRAYAATSITAAGNNTAAGTLTITGLPRVSNLRVRITMDNDNNAELWSIDDVKITGNPIPSDPTTSSISPSSATAGGAGFTLTVNGTNFVSGISTVTWNGLARSTSFVSTTQLTATITSAEIASAGNAAVGVSVTGAASASNTQNFTINAASMPGLAIAGTLAHGTICPGSSTAVKTYTITNNGTIANNVVISSSNPEFVVSNAPTSVAGSGGTATYDVTFTPSSGGAKTATITVFYNTSTVGATSDLTGTGTTPVSQAVTSTGASNVVNTTATLNGNATFGVCPSTNMKGFVYSKDTDNSDPFIGGSNVTNVSAAIGVAGAYSLALTGLTSNTLYRFRAYVFDGTTYVYSALQSFTTRQAATKLAFGTTPPTVGSVNVNLTTFTVRALRNDDSVDTEFVGTILLNQGTVSGAATLTGNSVAAVAGVATFSTSKFDGIGTFTLTGTSSGLASTAISSNIAITLANAPQILWNSASAQTWLTNTNWSPTTIPSATTVARFVNVGSSTIIGINMNSISLAERNVGAIDVASTNTVERTIRNSSTVATNDIILNGVVVNSIPNVILRNNSAVDLIVADGTSQAMGVVLGNTISNTVTIESTGNINVSSKISGGASNPLTKTGLGSGVLILSNPANTYTGATTITQGRLRLSPSSSPATFTSPIVLNGGTLSTLNITAATTMTSSATLGLTETSAIDLGTNSHTLRFAASNGVAWTAAKTITITGWTGTAGVAGTAGKLFVGTTAAGLTPTQLSQISFAGYSNGTTQLSTGEVVPRAQNTVTYSANNGMGTQTDAALYNNGATVTVLGAGSITRTGYTFANWNTVTDGSGTSYAPNATFVINTNTTLFAQWTINTYTVTYNSNGGTGTQTDANGPYNYNTTVTVLGIGSVTRAGFTFSNWDTASDGSGTAYLPGSSFAIASNTILYAQWTANSAPKCPNATGVLPNSSQNVCQGIAAQTLTATVVTGGLVGTPTIAYQWYYNSSNSNVIAGATLINGATSSTYTPLTTAAEANNMARYYFCVGYAADNSCAQNNASQDLASTPVAVTVIATPATPTITPTGATTFQTGGSVLLTSSAGTEYIWSNGAITQAITATAAGNYSVQVVVNGCLSGSSAPITVFVVPTVTTTTPATAVTYNSATLSGTVGDIGASAITATGIVYALSSQNATPTIGGTNVIQLATASPNAGTGSFSEVTGTALSANNTYAYRAYAISNQGTSYGSVQTFTTSNITAPTVAAASGIMTNSFVANWSAVTGATGYRLDVSTSPTFSTISEILNEGFEGATFPPTGWLSSGWTRSSSSGDINSGDAAAIAGSQSGTLTTSALANPASLSFYLGRSGNTTAKELAIEVSTTSATTGFANVATYNHSNVPSSSYNQYVVDLSAYTSNATVYVRFVKSSSTTSPWRLDDIVVTGAAPSFVSGYNNLFVAGNSQLVSGLMPNTAYYYRVRAESTNSTSLNSGNGTATTCNALVAPTGITGAIAICSGSSTSLTVTGGSAGVGGEAKWYTDSCGGTLVGSGTTLDTANLTANTTYYVRYEGGICNNVTDCTSVLVTVISNQTWYRDADSDTFGNATIFQSNCVDPSTPTENWVLNNTDCNDGVFAINPGVTEICWNNIDDNCNTIKSEGCAAIPVFINNPTPVSGLGVGTISNFATHLSAVPYTYAGATSLDYRFEVTNTSVTPNQTVEFTQTGVFARYFTIPVALRGFDTNYTIRASAVINGEEVPYAVPVITVRSTGIPTVKLTPTSCGATLSSVNATISANPGFNATSYEFRIRLTSDNGATPAYSYAQSMTRFIGANSFVGLSLQYGTSYSVSVRYATSSVGTTAAAVTSGFGEECTITTPSIPLISLNAPLCGSRIDRFGATISASPATYAQEYQFRVRLTSDNGPMTTYYTTVASASRYSSLMAAQGLVLTHDTQYSVSVRYSIPVAGGGTSFSAYGDECIIVTPMAAVLRTQAAAFKVVAYPNPFSEGFQLNVTTPNTGIVSIKAYDMLGRLIEERSSKVSTLENLTIGANYPSGVYNVIVSQEDEIRTVRVVKR